MGYMRHHAIVVTTTYGDLEMARAKAVDLGCSVSPVIASPVNGVASFLVAADGSKDGWPESDDGDRQRVALVDWLRGWEYEDGSGPFAWVEVQYGDENRQTRVIDDSDRLRRESIPVA